MLDLNWNKFATDNPVKLADYIELTIALDHDHGKDDFGYSDFIRLIRDEPFDDLDEDADQGFVDGDEADETKIHFESAVSLVEQRSRWLGELYPFEGIGDEVQFSGVQDHHKWMPYIFLLACSNHRFLVYQRRKFETGFERISKEAMRAGFNEAADVLLFSQFSDDRAQIGRSARDAIKEIAKRLRASVINESRIPNTQQEFGIDLIAIDPAGDVLSVPFAAFGQCTIGREWEAKKHEAQPRSRLAAYIHVTVDYSNLLFMPHFPRLETGEWDAHPHEVINCLLRDRYSICKMLERTRGFEDQSRAQSIDEVVDGFYDEFSA